MRACVYSFAASPFIKERVQIGVGCGLIWPNLPYLLDAAWTLKTKQILYSVNTLLKKMCIANETTSKQFPLKLSLANSIWAFFICPLF